MRVVCDCERVEMEPIHFNMTYGCQGCGRVVTAEIVRSAVPAFARSPLLELADARVEVIVGDLDVHVEYPRPSMELKDA